MENKLNNIKENIVDTLMDNYMPYAMSVIVSRAIPQIDGFKPSHRKLLYTMYEMGLLKGNRTKSSNVVGQTMKLNPHGDMAIYETMVKLAKSHENLLHAYVDSKGNFGKAHSRDMKFAAARYTEVRLEPIASEIFKDIDKNTVDFVDNYDATIKEPTLLPTTFPNILVKANKGIAVGMASSIPSFNLREICEFTIEYMKNKKIEVKEYINGPDLPTGGDLVYDESILEEIYSTGRGSFKLRGKYRHIKKENIIEIYEIPYTTTVEAIIEKIIELIKSGKIKEITDVRDETDLNGLKIAIDIRRSTDVDKLMAKIYKSTTLEDSFGCNFNVLINSSPRVMGIKELIDEWLVFRKNSIIRKAIFDKDKKSQKLKLLLGLKEILLDIDKAIKMIRETKKEKDVIANLMKGFSLDEEQAEYIADIKLRNLNEEYILKRIDEIDIISKEILDLEILSKDEKSQNKYIIKELKDVIQKYSADRKTTIIMPEDIVHHVNDNEVADYKVNIFLTNQGYIKKITDSSLRGNSEHKLKDDDYIIKSIQANNKDTIVAVSDKQNWYQIKLHELPDTKASLLGEYMPNILNMESDEKILKIIIPNDYKGHMYYIFANGKVAKISMKAYETKGFRKKMQNAYSNKSELVSLLYGEDEIFIKFLSSDGRVAIVDTSMLNTINSRNSLGVQTVKLAKKVSILSVEKIMKEIKEEIEVIKEDGTVEKEILIVKNDVYFEQSSKKIPAVFRTVEENQPIQQSLFDI
ncbi:MAG: DNA gyrase subunit A [Filifactoraceae bacterium]